MDFSTGHMAYSLHTQDAQRAEHERERLRVIGERAAEAGHGVVERPISRHRASVGAATAVVLGAAQTAMLAPLRAMARSVRHTALSARVRARRAAAL